MNVLTPQSSYIYMHCAAKYIQKKKKKCPCNVSVTQLKTNVYQI